MTSHTPYVGRFAPSPSGPLHRGSLVAALASFLDARAHQGRWLIRIEDADMKRTVAGAADHILQTLACLGMISDSPVMIQSQRDAAYQAAFDRLGNGTFACACTRREIADSRVQVGVDGAAVYPGTCRDGLASSRTAQAYRLRVPAAMDSAGMIGFDDRWQGKLSQDLANHVGDFVLKRADGMWAYQLAVVVDDAAQGITHVVRGADLLDSTTRQIYLQRLLGYATPTYLHVPTVVNARSEKLSKQTSAIPLDATDQLGELLRAADFLGLGNVHSGSIGQFWEAAVPAWQSSLHSR